VDDSCQPDCMTSAQALAEHGCYPIFLAGVRRRHASYVDALRRLDAEYFTQYNRQRPTKDDQPSYYGAMLDGMADIQRRCFDPLREHLNSSHLYRDLLPILPCEAVGASAKAFAVLDEFHRTVRARPGHSRFLRVSHSNPVFYGAFVWACGALNARKTAVPGPGSAPQTARTSTPSSGSTTARARARATPGST
jgi:hypothetical protein